ncbi:hypothetical protein [Candidatus Pelagibacter sp.]|uniref:hypothetical protein n=1 Tax=Candidatus Pelagibacter sp. TaxID=2024849 RepID=UPI003F85CE6C
MIKKILSILILSLLLGGSAYSEIRNFNCKFESEKYDLSIVDGDYQFNLEIAELISVDGEKVPKGPFAKEGVEVDISNGNIGLDVGISNLSAYLFINLETSESEVLFYKVNSEIDQKLINHLRKIVSKNIKNEILPYFQVIHSGNKFLMEKYPDSLVTRGNGQCY